MCPKAEERYEGKKNCSGSLQHTGNPDSAVRNSYLHSGHNPPPYGIPGLQYHQRQHGTGDSGGKSGLCGTGAACGSPGR